LTRAGVKTVMITGDHPATAARIAAELHIAPTEPQVLTGRDLAALSRDELAARLEEVQVFARVSPEQKVDVLEALQRRGEICAMLGDGVNDAIALKRADIGVAMGIKGTDVAKETADMLLLDDRFVTVGAAVHQGRIIYANIKKFVHYLFSCNLSEVATMLFATMLGEPLPLLPLQILWLNMVTDVFPALALALERGEADIMDRPPRPPESSLLDRRTVGSIVGYGLLITLAALTAFFYGRFVRGYQPVGRVDPAITMSFLTIGLAQLFHVFNSRKERGPLRGREWFSNPYVLGALVLTVGLQLAAVYMPGLKTVMRTSPPAAVDWLVIGACALMPLAAGQLYRRVVARKPASSRA
ncbi:MAG: cation-transporting P-type ATPase, partial [Candidatus Brocadiae bacterium]|nr:cation-transporting P-type ATPase [Candidatus Brocadiia bacterium]